MGELWRVSVDGKEKYYKEGTIIDLEQWESRAICCAAPEYKDCLRFSTEDVDGREDVDQIDIKNFIEVGSEDIIRPCKIFCVND
mgnify:CR=1 FL=1